MRIRTCLRTLLCLAVFLVPPAMADEIRDYYAEPGINPFKETLDETQHESIDPFSGTLQLKYTDIHVPGNGGLDIDVIRTYTSLQTNAYPKLGRNGLGWTMHFGRIVTSRNNRDKICAQGAFPLTTKENPSLERPDGGRELLVLNGIQNDGTLITRSNWRAQCTTGIGMVVTAPNGTRYFMDHYDDAEEEPSWLTSRIEDVHGNWIAIDYALNGSGISYITQIRRSEEGAPVVTFEYEDQGGPGIAVSAIHANGQTWSYHYETIPGFFFNFYKQLVRVNRPDGTSWVYTYNPKMPDPDPNDDVIDDGIASFSLIRVNYPYGAQVDYTYQFVEFDPASATEKTTSIATKQVSGAGVTAGTWTYAFAPHSDPFADSYGGQLRYDVTTVTAPEAIYRYKHYGKDVRAGTAPNFGFVFIRPSYVGMLISKETWSRGASSRLIERRVNSWTARKISEEDFWHGAGYRDWWRDDGTYVPMLVGEFVNRDSHAGDADFRHARRYYDYDAYGNPGRVVDYSNIANQPAHQVVYTYFNDTAKWIIGLPQLETHRGVGGTQDTTVGTVERVYDAFGQITSIVQFGKETRYTYTDQGDVATMRDARGNITRYSDYKRGVAQTEARPEAVTIHRDVNDTGTLHSQTSGRGNLTRYSYDDLNRLTAIDYPIGADVSVQYQNGLGVYRRILTRGGYRQTDTLNDFGEIQRVQREDTGSGQSIVSTSEYDAHHRRVFESYPNATIGTRTTYDALGRVLTSTHPDNTAIVYEYDDSEITAKDERQFLTRFLNLVYGLDFSGQNPVTIDEPENVSTILRRDLWGDVVELFQGERRSGAVYGYGKTFRYDERHLLVETVEREVGKKVFDHDEMGNVISEQLNTLPPVTFQYDRLNRRTLVDFADSTPDVVTQYDADSNPEHITKGTTRWDYTYDANNNLRNETLTITHPLLGQRVFTLAHDYTNIDALAQTTYPSGLVVAYDPDALGRATHVGSFASNVTYHPSGQVASYQLANGVTTNLALNQRLLTQSISAPGVVNLNYTYDASGNVQQILDGIDASKSVQMNSTSYDGLGRLVSSNGKWGAASFAYDFNGNLKTRNVGTRGLRYYLDDARHVRTLERFNPATPDTLTGVTRYDFDGRGNASAKRQYNYSGASVESIDDRYFDYDAASQLIRTRVSHTTGAGEALVAATDYVYDGNGQRVVEQKHGTYDIRFSVYTQSGQLLFEDSIAECTRTDYVRLGALSIARSDDRSASPSLDSDSDGIPDCMETQLGLNPNNSADAAADRDGDGISNLAEFRAGTSLTRADTDGDGISDANEVNRDLTDPTNADSDGDGLNDGVEAVNPALDARGDDRDHDGVSDFWEVQLGTNPNDASDALLDTDGDGFSNRQESLGKSDPLRATSTPARGTELFTSNSFGRFFHELAIGRDRNLYLTGDDGKVYGFYPDGKRRWVFPIPASKLSEPTVGPDGTIYVVSQLSGGVQQGAPRSYVYALNPDGTQRWVYSTTDFLESAAAIGNGGRLYIGGFFFNSFSGSSGGVVLAIDANGQAAARTTTADTVQIAPAVSFSGDVFVGDYDGIFRVFTPDLQPRWTYSMHSRISTPASIGDDGTVYAGDESGYVYAWTKTGSLRWEQQVSPTGPQYSSVTIANNGVLYVGTYDSRLRAMSATDGSTLWTATTSGTVFTPALASDGTVYATTYAGDLLAYDATGAQLWSMSTGVHVRAAPMVDRDGTIYFGSELGQVFAVADNGGGPARTAWPMRRHDSAATSYTCFNERAFSISADSDGDHIDDCAELRYGLNPADPADGAADMDGDGLANWEEQQAGTRLDVADTDGDGLNDGLELRTYHTDPKLADTDHDTIPDGVEVQIHTNPLDVSDANVDSDGDGFSNRQESWAGTDLLNASSRPTVGQALRVESDTTLQKKVAVGRDGILYQNGPNGLEALNPDFSPKWRWPTQILGTPVIGRDGTLYVSTVRDSSQQTQRLVALLPNGAVRWSVTFQSPSSAYGLYDAPALGPNGAVYVVETGTDSSGDMLWAYDANGVQVWGHRVFGRKPSISVAADGNVLAFDPINSLSMMRASNGTEVWRQRNSPVVGGGTLTGPVIGPDGTIYVNNGNGIVAVDPANGQARWRASSAQGYPLIDSQGRVIVYCISQENLCALDSATGAVLWTDTNSYRYEGAPTIDADGSILALTRNNMFVALNSDGSPRWQTPLNVLASADSPVILNDGTIYVGASGVRVLLVGSARAIGNTPWATRNRDQKNTRSAADMSDVPPSQTPILTITAPTAQSIRVDVGQAINATALASDFQDGDLRSAIQWTSSLSGLLGTGPQLPLGGLAVGTHTLTASVTDSDGNTSSATRTVEVGVFPPEVTLYQPYEGVTYDIGEQVEFYATATDVKDGDISANIRWLSDRDGQLGVGQSLTRSNLSAGAHRITAQSTDSSGGVTNASVNILVQAKPPSLDVYTPYDLEEFEFGQPADFAANAYDALDGDLSANIHWSSNLDGALGVGGNISVSNLRLGTHVITASVADSTGAPASVSRTIIVRHLPPDLSVYSPGYYTVVQYGDTVSFEGYASDNADGELTASIQWSSPLDGPIGTGGSFERSDLSVGMHLITAKVTDSDNQTATQQRYLVVQSSTNSAPFVSISAPAAGTQVYLNDPVTLTGTAYDTQDGVISASIQWSSDLQGALGTGASLTVSTLQVGTHTLRAFAQDSSNGKGAATVQITVLPIPPNYPPTIKITSIGVGARYTTDSAFVLSAVASDREEGDISSRITWSSSINGPLGSGATVTVAGLSAGVHHITARVVDTYGNVTTQTRSMEIFADGDALLLDDNFSVIVGPDALSGWQKFDDGTSFPSAWVLGGDGTLAEYGNARAGSTAATAIEKPGTYQRQTTGTNWLDYRLEATLRSTDNDGIGLMFRFVDNNNYYRFSMDSERGFRRIVKKVNGVYTLLWADAVPYVVGQSYNVAITAQGSNLTLAIDGVQLWTGTDTSLRRGTIALYAWEESAAIFDNIRVTNLRTAQANDPPQLSIVSPANNSSFVVGSVVALNGTALDIEDGTLSQNIAWSSSLDGSLGTGATLNVSTLRIGTHVMTASVSDSKGVVSTATVTITIAPPFNQPPTINVTAPSNGATFNIGTPVNFAGTASDAEDGNISNGISWTSSRNGLLGTGSSLTVSTLSAGVHTITASITDSGIKTATATRTITVQVPGNNQPTLTLTAPLNGNAFAVGQPVALSGTATDTEDGNLTAQIAWTSSINGALGTGGSLNVSTLSSGVHTITAAVNDSMGGTRSVTSSITVVPTAGVLLRDDFSDNAFDGWTVTDEGTVSAPSVWSASTGALRQTSDISSTPTTAATIPKPGTFNRYVAGSAWTNYSITTELRSSDDDVLGVMFRYTNTNNYYRFSLDAERANRRLAKKRNGTWTTIWQDTTAFQLNRTYVLEIIANGSTLTVKLDGVQLWTGTDTQALTSGTVAMYSWMNTGAQFDNVLVRNLSVPLASRIPSRAPRVPDTPREPLVELAMVLPRFGTGSVK